MTKDEALLLADAYATAVAQQGEAHDHVARDALEAALRELVAERDNLLVEKFAAQKNAEFWGRAAAKESKANKALVEALRYHMEQTRPIQQSIDALAKHGGAA